MDAQIAGFAIAVVLLAATAQTVAGFGFALVAVPLLVTVLDVRDAVVVVTILGLVNNAIVARTAWRHVPWQVIRPMFGGALAGMPLGLLVLLLAPEDALRLAVGAVTIVMAAALAAGLSLRGGGLAANAGVGVVSGVLNTSTGMNGPPVVLYLQGQRHEPAEFRAALAVFFFACSAVTLAAFAAAGIISRDALFLSGAALPAVATGSWLGHMAYRRLDPVSFRWLVLGLLVVSALSAVGSSLVRTGTG